uniref:Salivary lipocalin n=1 Tax=Ornithodoros brasiliensis TaxID=888526 RepID=A0A1D2AIK9_ORNBR
MDPKLVSATVFLFTVCSVGGESRESCAKDPAYYDVRGPLLTYDGFFVVNRTYDNGTSSSFDCECIQKICARNVASTFEVRVGARLQRKEYDKDFILTTKEEEEGSHIHNLVELKSLISERSIIAGDNEQEYKLLYANRDYHCMILNGTKGSNVEGVCEMWAAATWASKLEGECYGNFTERCGNFSYKIYNSGCTIPAITSEFNKV